MFMLLYYVLREMCLWDLHDARCVELRQSRELHEHVRAHRRCVKGDIVLICGGKYPYINVMNPLSLETLFLLHMYNQANWILSMTVFHKKDLKREQLLFNTYCWKTSDTCSKPILFRGCTAWCDQHRQCFCVDFDW